MVLVITGLFLIIFGLSVYLAHDHYRQTEASLLASDRLTANLLSDLLFEHEQTSSWVLRAYRRRESLIRAVTNKDLAGVMPHLMQLKKDNEEVDSAFITNAKGILWANYPVDRSAFNADLSYRDWYRGVSRLWEPYISGVFKKIVDKKQLAVAICTPILDDNGDVAGILAHSQLASFLGDILNKVPRRLYEYVTLIDKDGNIIYSTRFPSLDSVQRYAFASSVAGDGGAGRVEVGASGVGARNDRLILTTASLRDIGWKIVVERSRGSILRAEYRYIAIVAPIAFLFFALLSLLLLYIRNRLAFTEALDKLKMERELRAREEQFTELFEHMSSGVAVYQAVKNGEDFIITNFNGAAEKIDRIPREEVLGRSVREIFTGIVEFGLFDVLKRVYRTGRPERHGPLFYQDQRIKGWRDNYVLKLSLGDIVTVYDDVTTQKETENTLRRQANRLTNLHEIDKAILLAVESSEEIAQTALQQIRGLLDCKRAMVSIFKGEGQGTRVLAVESKGQVTLDRGKDLSGAVYSDIEILRQGKMEIIEDSSKVASSPGTTRMFDMEGVRSCVSAPLLSAKGLFGALNVAWEDPKVFSSEQTEIIAEMANQIGIVIEQHRLREETERYALELEQRVKERTSQFETANKELETFSYSVSHDLRAPLRHISGYVDLLVRKFHDSLPEQGRHYLNTISDSVVQMGVLIDDLLLFSRTGRQEIHLETIDMNLVVQEVIQALGQVTAGRRIEWVVAELPYAHGDYMLLKLVWSNLLDNAVKFTRVRDSATIEIGCREDNCEDIFFVRDNGVGFDMRYSDKLFGIFQRLHSLSEFEGTGIGLASVRRIISRHGGRTWAEAEPGKGATVYFSLHKIREVSNGTSQEDSVGGR